eukprot:TRINITY_DN1472_c0_g1_i3.p1 TRINITY_DN1472_c0_g1~~TRINITY_DN1472_c0_g1_i3.p1  ORF type:complete len:462 (-),score=86.51 TRINITY_DN1472_c0_g1_i3:58-1443(-)
MDDGYYGYASGALQEAWSDILAETFSIFWNGSGYYPPRSPERHCILEADNKRWIVGDEVELMGNCLRDLYNPTCTGQPDSISTLVCSPYDNSGVHSNCGPISVLYTLLVDGGVYHEHSYVGVGILKAWHIFFQYKSTYEGKSETYQDMAAHLTIACNDLVVEAGNLIDQYGNVTDLHVTTSDCNILDTLIDDVGFSELPCSAYVFFGVFPPYVPTSGTTISIITSGTPSTQEFFEIGSYLTSGTPQNWTLFSDNPGWNANVLFNISKYQSLGLTQMENVPFKFGADAQFQVVPDVDPHSFPMNLTFFNEPLIDYLDPGYGNESGGYNVTVVGTGFQHFNGPCSPITGFAGDCLVCGWWDDMTGELVMVNFGHWIDESHVNCVVPPGIGAVYLALSLNLNDFTKQIKFIYGPAPNMAIGIIIVLAVFGGVIAVAVICIVGYVIVSKVKARRTYQPMPSRVSS